MQLYQKEIQISVIVPIRLSLERKEVLERLSVLLNELSQKPEYEVIIVDDGSINSEVKKLVSSVADKGKIYYTRRPPDSAFSLSKARNLGAKKASGKYLLIFDVDLLFDARFFNDILLEISIQSLNHHKAAFLMIPVIYLTEKGTSLFLQTPSRERRQRFIHEYLCDHSEMIEQASSGTSCVLVSREQFLGLGGYNERFEGWGYEDYEFNLKLIEGYPIIPRPPDYKKSSSNFVKVCEFSGWKSRYRLYGDLLAQKGIYLFHGYHTKTQGSDTNKKKNWELLIQTVDSVANKKKEPTKKQKALLLKKSPFTYNEAFQHALQDGCATDPASFSDANAFLERFQEASYDIVIFQNPYATDKTEELYQACREHGIPYLICERGALPDSLFYDPNGFLFDSSSYSPERWDRALSGEQKRKVREYIQQVVVERLTLEAQNMLQRVSPEAIRKRLNIKLDKKILFVPFQQVNDSVIRKFSGDAKSFESFHSLVGELAEELVDDWVVLYKKHPVEDSLADIGYALEVDDYHVYDLVELADACLMINSGVGVTSLMMDKPTFTMGESWYTHEGLAQQVRSKEEIMHRLNVLEAPNKESTERFIYYLSQEFYSFGKMEQRKCRYSDGSPITSTSAIDIYTLRGWGDLDFDHQAFSVIPISSPLFDRYGLGKVGGNRVQMFLSSNRLRWIQWRSRLSKGLVGNRVTMRKRIARLWAKLKRRVRAFKF